MDITVITNTIIPVTDTVVVATTIATAINTILAITPIILLTIILDIINKLHRIIRVALMET